MAATATPARSLEMRRQALQQANEIRFARACLKREVKAGRREVADLVEEAPAFLQTMKVVELMDAQPHMGRARALALLEEAGVSPRKTVGGLGRLQKARLLPLLRAWRPPEYVLRAEAAEPAAASAEASAV